jgi:putative transposase
VGVQIPPSASDFLFLTCKSRPDHRMGAALSLTGLLVAEKGEKPVADLRPEHSIAEQKAYRWRRRYGGLDTSDVQRLKELTGEDARLKRLPAERDLEVDALKELLAEKECLEIEVGR